MDAAVLESIRGHDIDLAQKIMDKMFVFDDVAKAGRPLHPDRAARGGLRDPGGGPQGAQPEVRDKILNNMSARAAAAMREDLESRGPMRLSEVERSSAKFSRPCAAWPTKARSH